jgi:hypothetical protein
MDMKAADDRVLQRHDVIDLVSDASGARQPVRFGVDRVNGIFVDPRRSSVEFHGHSFCVDGRSPSVVLLFPSLVGISAQLGVSQPPRGIVFALVVAILTVPVRMTAWILKPEFRTSLSGARLARKREAIERCSPRRELIAWFCQSTEIARFYVDRCEIGLSLAFGCQGGIPNTGAARFTDGGNAKSSASWSSASHPPDSVKPMKGLFDATFGARLSNPFGHFARSMWLSMMRLTSSAIGIPSRLDSLARYARCGSVNEIICLIIGATKIPQGIGAYAA